MAKGRKIKCDCGRFLTVKRTLFGGFETEAMVCPKCNFVTLTKAQAEKYAKLKQLHQIIDAERKIIKIGNSMGFTLPDSLKEFGAKIGKRIKTEALDYRSFKVELGDCKRDYIHSSKASHKIISLRRHLMGRNWSSRGSCRGSFI